MGTLGPENDPQFEVITNSSLECATCQFAFMDTLEVGNTSQCEKYTRKPGGVLANRKACPEYKAIPSLME
jgi:hypothetical protein